MPTKQDSQLKQKVQKITQAIQKQKLDSYIVKKQVEDLAFDFVIGDTEGREWYDSSKSTESEPLNPELKFIKKLATPGDVVFECGTHHGLTAILIANWVGEQGQVVCFEINHKNAQIARKNIEINQLKNVSLVEKGLGSQKNILKIFNKSNASITPSNIISFGRLKNFLYGTSEVEIITLDEYAKTNSLLPTFIKIDVEGYEAEVLKGATEILKTLPKLEIEIHTEILSRYHTSVEEILKLIDVDRYQLWVQWNDSEAPQLFDLQQKIDRRVHLFAEPKTAD